MAFLSLILCAHCGGLPNLILLPRHGALEAVKMEDDDDDSRSSLSLLPDRTNVLL
jgi:hypothetical protein